MRERALHAWRAALFTCDFVQGDGDTWVKRRSGTPVVTAHVTPGGRAVPYERYAVPGTDGRRRPAIVVTHGFTHEGNHDPRLQALCARLARAGFVVTAPEFDEMRQYRLGFGDLADLEAAVAALAGDPVVDASRVGVMAFSFGAAPTLIGLSRPPLKDQVAFALIFGGYFELRRTFKYVLTGAYDGFGHRGQVAVPTDGDDRWKFMGGNLYMLPPSPTSEAFADAVGRRAADLGAAVDTGGWSDAERAAFALFENRDPARFDALYDAAAPHLDPWVQRLSPAPSASTISAQLFLVHSRTDPKTPFIESIAMSRGVPQAPPPMLAIVNAFSHVDLQLDWRSLSSLVRNGLPGLFAVWRVVYGVLRLARVE